MIYDLKNEYQIPKFKEYVNKLFKERAVVEVKKKLPNRTLAQNSYLHLLLGYFGSEYGCFQWFKDTNLKANHNRHLKCILFRIAVSNGSKILI